VTRVACMATAWRFRRKVLLGVLDVSAASCTNKEPWVRWRRDHWFA